MIACSRAAFGATLFVQTRHAVSAGSEIRAQASGDTPLTSDLAHEGPRAGGGAGRQDRYLTADGTRECPVGVRQSPSEGFENGDQKRWVVQRWSAGGVANLLLVVPLLRVLARNVEPVRRGRFASPGDAKPRCMKIHCPERFEYFQVVPLDEFNENLW